MKLGVNVTNTNWVTQSLLSKLLVHKLLLVCGKHRDRE